jgi:putative ABC transport system ATP-binding protein
MAEICIEQLIPVPLKDTLRQRPSQVWLQEVRFEPGTFIHIQAPSGSGKSTFIHSLYGLRRDYEGRVLLNGKLLQQYSAEELAVARQSLLSIVFQDLRLFDTLTARENILVKRSLRSYHPEEMTDVFARRLCIDHKLDQACATLSYGEQQRIAIIRSLMQPFDWLLLDEPFSHLDRENIKRAASLIREECTARKAGIIMTDLEDDDHFNYTQKLLL